MQFKQASQLLKEARKLRRKATREAKGNYYGLAEATADLADRYERKAWELVNENPN